MVPGLRNRDLPMATNEALLTLLNRATDAQDCLVVGEVGLTHDGSLGLAHAFIDAIADAGADGVKFQTHIAGAESTPSEPWRIPFSRQDSSRYEYWERTSFSEQEWKGLKEHADGRELLFLSSPFSVEAIDLLLGLGMETWKVASGEVGNAELTQSMINSGLPLLISTGMSSLAEIDDLVARCKAAGTRFAILQCTSAYPCPPELVGINLIQFFSERYDCVAGLSDHSGTIYPGLAAATLGAGIIEVHVAMSRRMFGPDVPASVTVEELGDLVRGVRFINEMIRKPIDKDEIAAELAPLRQIFVRSLVSRSDLTAGTILERRHLALKKPGTGISAQSMDQVLGRRLLRDLRKDELLQLDYLEDLK